MQEKYKIIIFFLFICFLLFSKDEKNISVYFKYDNTLKDQNVLLVNALIDIAESNISENYQNINLVYNKEKVENLNIRQISGKIISLGEDCFFLVDASSDSTTIKVDIKLYSPILDVIYQDKLNIEIINNENSISSEYEIGFILIINKAIDAFLLQKDTYKIKTKLLTNEIKYAHDFPLINIYLSAISLKIYFDTRTYSKMFSFFPIDLRISFFPLKYFEAGVFFDLHAGDMVYKLYDYDNKELRNYESPLDFNYGIYCGFSVFGDFYHYSTGIQIYNFFYNVYGSSYLKPWGAEGNILIQFAHYEKLDIKIFKYLNYSIFINLKTMPMFYSQNGYLYSKPFYYDFVTLEFSLIGFSLTF